MRGKLKNQFGSDPQVFVGIHKNIFTIKYVQAHIIEHASSRHFTKNLNCKVKKIVQNCIQL